MRAPLTVAAVLLLAAGCGFDGVRSLPLPGGADLGAHPREVTIEFADALDLVPRSACKVHDVTVGEVVSVGLSASWRAEVVCALSGAVELPVGSTAAIAQSSLLGEKYVRLDPAAAGPRATRLPLAATTAAAEVEQVLAAAGAVLNGGGLEQLATINAELDQVLGGRQGRLRGLLRRLEGFAAALDGSKGEIVRLLDALDRLAGLLAARRQTIAEVATRIGPAVAQLREQRAELTGLLRGLDRFGRTTTRIVARSQEDTLANLRQLRRILTDLDRAGTSLARGLGTALTFPFPPSATGLLRGDYGNVDVTVDLTPGTTLENLR